MDNIIKTKILVLGSGPGGYSAAFRSSDLGMETTLVERDSTLGGVCLNVGCIPSKALLHVVKSMNSIEILRNHGIFSENLLVDVNCLRTWKEGLVSKLSHGLSFMAKSRNVKVVNGYGSFISDKILKVENDTGNSSMVYFEHVIIAVGSIPLKISFVAFDNNSSRIWDSADALSLKFIPKKLLIIGAGIIGLEIATVYNFLGAKIDIVERYDEVLSSIDQDVVSIFLKCIKNKFNLILGTEITKISIKNNSVYVSMKNLGDLSVITNCYDAVLVSIGRVPNSKFLDNDLIGLKIDSRGFIQVDKQMRTNISHIFAIGDVVGEPMLAHKAIHQGHVAAEVISGRNCYFDPQVIPCIVYSDPEIAWVGITEKEAQKLGIRYGVSIFPWQASGRANIVSCFYGITKLIFNKTTNRIIGGVIVGTNAGELLGEIALAIEMGCDADDLALTIHAHPTLYESIGLAASVYTGSITDLLNVQVKGE